MTTVTYSCLPICPTAPEAPPANVIASPHSTTSIKVEWKPVPECERNGEITTYIVEVFNSTGSEVKHANVSGFSTVIEDLEEYTNYTVRVFAWSAAGRESPPSENQSTTTHLPGSYKESNNFVARVNYAALWNGG